MASVQMNKYISQKNFNTTSGSSQRGKANMTRMGYITNGQGAATDVLKSQKAKSETDINTRNTTRASVTVGINKRPSRSVRATGFKDMCSENLEGPADEGQHCAKSSNGFTGVEESVFEATVNIAVLYNESGRKNGVNNSVTVYSEQCRWKDVQDGVDFPPRKVDPMIPSEISISSNTDIITDSKNTLLTETASFNGSARDSSVNDASVPTKIDSSFLRSDILTGANGTMTTADIEALNADTCEALTTTMDYVAESLEKHHVHAVYDSTAHHFSDARYRAWPRVREFLQQLPMGSVVADVGCGHGKYLNLNEHIVTLGSDYSAPLMQLAKSRTGREVTVADTLTLPYRTGCMDAVISVGVLHHLSTVARRVRALRELCRVLRPGGKLLIYVWAWEQDKRQFKSQDVLVPWHLCSKQDRRREKSKTVQKIRSQSETRENCSRLFNKGAEYKFGENPVSSNRPVRSSSSSLKHATEPVLRTIIRNNGSHIDQAIESTMSMYHKTSDCDSPIYRKRLASLPKFHRTSSTKSFTTMSSIGDDDCFDVCNPSEIVINLQSQDFSQDFSQDISIHKNDHTSSVSLTGTERPMYTPSKVYKQLPFDNINPTGGINYITGVTTALKTVSSLATIPQPAAMSHLQNGSTLSIQGSTEGTTFDTHSLDRNRVIFEANMANNLVKEETSPHSSHKENACSKPSQHCDMFQHAGSKDMNFPFLKGQTQNELAFNYTHVIGQSYWSSKEGEFNLSMSTRVNSKITQDLPDLPVTSFASILRKTFRGIFPFRNDSAGEQKKSPANLQRARTSEKVDKRLSSTGFAENYLESVGQGFAVREFPQSSRPDNKFKSEDNGSDIVTINEPEDTVKVGLCNDTRRLDDSQCKPWDCENIIEQQNSDSIIKESIVKPSSNESEVNVQSSKHSNNLIATHNHTGKRSKLDISSIGQKPHINNIHSTHIIQPSSDCANNSTPSTWQGSDMAPSTAPLSTTPPCFASVCANTLRNGSGSELDDAHAQQRYYHVFRSGELDALLGQNLPEMRIIQSTYDHANWCVIAQKCV